MEIIQNLWVKYLHLISGLKNGRYFTNLFRLVTFCRGNYAVFSNEVFLSSPFRLANFCGENSVCFSNLFSILKGKKIPLAGFTLAEVLITFGVIGIVAALTIPNVTRYFRNRELEAQLKYTYSTLNQVINMYYADTGDRLGPTGSIKNRQMLRAVLMKYMKVVKDCGDGVLNGPCTMDGSAEFDYQNLTGTSLAASFWFSYTCGQFITDKGTLISVRSYKDIYVDINGHENPPNMVGLDTFWFQISDDGTLKPAGDCNFGARCYYRTNNGRFERNWFNYYANGADCVCNALQDPNYWRMVGK